MALLSLPFVPLLIMDNIVYAYAGCGVVADSDADEEYIETNNKMRTILDAL